MEQQQTEKSMYSSKLLPFSHGKVSVITFSIFSIVTKKCEATVIIVELVLEKKKLDIVMDLTTLVSCIFVFRHLVEKNNVRIFN